MKTVQQKVKEFNQKYNLAPSLESKVFMLMYDVGELAEEALKMSNYGKSAVNPAKPTAKMAIEIGEILFNIAAMANAMNIDLEEAFDLGVDSFTTKAEKLKQ